MAASGRNGSSDKADSYRPGMYHETMPKVYDIIEGAFREWKKEKQIFPKNLPLICISRKIGVGSYEIAEMVAKKINYRVYDREILEYLINTKDVDQTIREFLDERCPSGLETLLAKILRETVFKSENTKLLFKAIFTIANLGPTIFVGRGAHLVLPRDRVLAIRLTCSNEYRSRRLARILGISETSASLRLAHLDIEQKSFFKNVYNLKTAPKEEFDMILYMDHFKNPNAVAGIIVSAFENKFGVNLSTGGRDAG
ncbi:MAG: cytidylate kinase-like family protein [Desulfobacteraceae bacterium]|nr:MAG: cytidylate kinase-like family protein [Desulfobacteraceae bacterium]